MESDAFDHKGWSAGIDPTRPAELTYLEWCPPSSQQIRASPLTAIAQGTIRVPSRKAVHKRRGVLRICALLPRTRTRFSPSLSRVHRLIRRPDLLDPSICRFS